MKGRIRQPDDAGLAAAADMLRAGGLVAMPTETVYGLAADATNDAACAKIFEAKDRPRFNPLIVHVADAAAAACFATFLPLAEKLAAAFWPGPLTLVLPLRADSGLSPLVSAGLETVALRVPVHSTAQALLATAGCPLAAPSANPSGGVSPTTAAHVQAGLGEAVDVILDGGASPVGLESTIVKVRDEKAVLLRPGGLSREEIEAVAGPLAAGPDKAARPQAPGGLESHYAPAAKVRLNATTPRSGEAFLGFGAIAVEGGLNLSPSGNLVEAAAHFFDYLRRLDASGADIIAVAPVPDKGLGEAINDRLRRAAAPRS